jgi:hypothetical protein
MNAQDHVDTILRPMTLTQKAICGLPHKTGFELLFLNDPKNTGPLQVSKVVQEA